LARERRDINVENGYNDHSNGASGVGYWLESNLVNSYVLGAINERGTSRKK
jgi:hypothetical protein